MRCIIRDNNIAITSVRLEETHEGLAGIKAGRLSDGAEIMNWLDSWGDENEKAPPEA